MSPVIGEDIPAKRRIDIVNLRFKVLDSVERTSEMLCAIRDALPHCGLRCYLQLFVVSQPSLRRACNVMAITKFLLILPRVLVIA